MIDYTHTPSEDELKKLHKMMMDGKIGVASRGVGQVDENGVIKEMELISFDLVTSPGFKNATIRPVKRIPWWKRIFQWVRKKIINLFKKI